jgi:hypothetical protein
MEMLNGIRIWSQPEQLDTETEGFAKFFLQGWFNYLGVPDTVTFNSL